MNTPIIYIKADSPPSQKQLAFLDILLDETLLYGTIYVPKICFSSVSTLNRRLPAKQPYELVLRLAMHFPIVFCDSPIQNTDDFQIFEFHEMPLTIESLITDCYIVSRYKKVLLEQQLFDAAIESILFAADTISCKDNILSILPDFLSEKENYRYFFLGSEPFLIYTGDPTCYNILSVFGHELGNALSSQGYLVEYFDLSSKKPAESVALVGRYFQAIIGIQSYMFSIRLENNKDFLHDLIWGPKYNFVFDHPIRFANHLRETPQNITILTPDRNYAQFAKKHYGVNAFFLPPAGIQTIHISATDLRPYDVSFIASYDNFTLERLREVHSLPRKERFLINRVWSIIRKNPTLTIETALKEVLPDNTNFFEIYHRLRSHLFCISDYYRYLVLKTLLDAGIKVDVFGNSWISSSLREHPCFIWHPDDLSTEECLKVWQQSKVALNVMSWHKDAITERILNSMLQKAVVVTERNPYITENFDESQDLLLYDLDKLSLLPELILSVLSDMQYQNHIAGNGARKAKLAHTWFQRSLELLNILDESYK